LANAGQDVRARRWPAAGITIAVLLAAGAAALAGQRGSGLALAVESLSGGSSDALQQLGAGIPAAYAFVAGIVAAVNPCGFAMLPGYLALYLDDPASGSRAGIPRALAVSGSVALSFVALFGAIGLLLGLAGGLVSRVLPGVSLLVGIVLVIVGARTLTGGPLYTSAGETLSGRLAGMTSRRDLRGYAAYGLAYGLTSVSCTLPIFLSVVGTSLVAPGIASAALQFVLYALGMAVVLALATLAAALFRGSILARLRGFGRWMQPVMGAVLLAVGGYIVYYWLSFGQLLRA